METRDVSHVSFQLLGFRHHCNAPKLKAQDIAKLKESVPGRLKFFRRVFNQLGIKSGQDTAVSLSLTYVICKSKAVHVW